MLTMKGKSKTWQIQFLIPPMDHFIILCSTTDTTAVIPRLGTLKNMKNESSSLTVMDLLLNEATQSSVRVSNGLLHDVKIELNTW